MDSNLAESQCVISEDITEFLSTWDVTEYPSTVNNVDAIWSSTAEEQRENILLKQVFVIERNSGFSSKSTTHLDVSVAESALKVRDFLVIFRLLLNKVDGAFNSRKRLRCRPCIYIFGEDW